MSVAGLCSICGRVGQRSCALCGRVVCDGCFEPQSGACAVCRRGMKM